VEGLGKMKKNNKKAVFELSEYFDYPLTKTEFKIAKQLYIEKITNSSFSFSPTSNIIELLKLVKRNEVEIGPYKGLTVFESLNRIGSDLVLLTGAERLFNNEIEGIYPETIELKLGNKAGFDIVVKTMDGKTIYGEGYNVAKSFCKFKTRQTIDKFEKSDNVKSSKKAIILINKDVETEIREYKNKKTENLKNKNGLEIVYVFCEIEN
jgi:hypothetical protein